MYIIGGGAVAVAVAAIAAAHCAEYTYTDLLSCFYVVDYFNANKLD